MPMVVISGEAERAIYSHAMPGRESSTPKNTDGTFTIWLSDDTVVFLSQHHFPGEDLSDTIIRLCSTVKGVN